MLIRVGDFTFHGGDLPGLTGFTIASWDGWTGGPGQKRNATERDGAAGSTRVPSFAADRVFSWRGLYLGSSLADVEFMGEALTGLEGRDAQVTVQRGSTRWVPGQISRVRFEEAGWKAEADYQVEVYLPDPFKYGESRTFEATGTGITTSSMYHRGNTDAVPRFRVTGTFPNGYSLFAGDRVVQVSGSASAVTDELDMYTGRFVRNGSMDPRLMQIARFWTVPGGASKGWAFDRKSGTGAATATLTDTFL